jgi:hypothetical protein
METEKICPECLKPLGSGRPDRRFCTVACRINYHNKEKIYENAEIKKIDNILKHNRRALKKILGNENEKLVSREKLLKLGFEFDYYTHHRQSKVKQYLYTFCFDYGYRKADGEFYKIVKAFTYKED